MHVITEEEELEMPPLRNLKTFMSFHAIIEMCGLINSMGKCVEK
jgi:hypothetical protein